MIKLVIHYCFMDANKPEVAQHEHEVTEPLTMKELRDEVVSICHHGFWLNDKYFVAPGAVVGVEIFRE